MYLCSSILSTNTLGPYVGHDNLKVFPHYKVQLTFYILHENVAKNLKKFTQISYGSVLQYSLCFEKKLCID